jgi:hypothetical protein
MGFAIFHYTKERQNLRFLSDFREVNKKSVRKPFPIPKISTMLQEIEGFSFATALDLKLAITPLDWIQMHPKSAPSYFLGENIPTSNYQWVLQVLLTFSKERCWS